MRVNTSFAKVASTALLLSVFVALGFWQLNRAEEKIFIRDRALARAGMPPIELDGRALDVDAHVYRSATANGRYLQKYQILLDNKVHLGRPGFHVLTPLLLSGTDILILVNRGWVPWQSDRRQIPEVGVLEGRIRVRGRLATPVRHAISFEDADGDRGFRQVWQNLDLESYEHLTEYSVQKLILRLDPEETDVGGLIREWPIVRDVWIERHRAYAFQWFGLAVAVVCIFVVLSLKRRV